MSGDGHRGRAEVVAETHRKAALIVAALALGVATFAVIATLVVTTGALGEMGSLSEGVRWGIVGVAALTLGAARPIERKLAETPRSADAEAIAGAWLTSKIVGTAMREGVGMMGGVLILLGDLPAGLALAGASVGLILLAFPLRRNLEERMLRAGR